MVTGSRSWTDRSAIERDLRSLPKGSVVIHGACPTGADAMADEIARALGLEVETYPAEWSKYGRAAGPKRNQSMVDTRPDVVFAYLKPASRGTAHAIRCARREGLDVRITQKET